MARRRTSLRMRAAVLAVCLLLAAACGAAQEAGGAEGEATTTPAPPTGVDAAAAPSDDGTARDDADGAVDVEGDDRPVERSLRPTIDAAVRDLAARVQVDPGEISVVLAQRVIWPDQTIGCPLRGDERIGGPRQGVRVHLEAGDRVYRYHSGGTREEPFLCDPQAVKSEEHSDRIEP